MDFFRGPSSGSCGSFTNAPPVIDIEAALEYARRHHLEALVIDRGGDVIAEAYGDEFERDTPHTLFSGTKSFWGVAAVVAQSEGLLAIDEPVADTLEGWRTDPWKRRVTFGMLLSLTAGHGFGGLGSAVPPFERALEMPLVNEPGTAFTYTGISLQVFGAAFERKLAPLGMTPQQYLLERVLDPAQAPVAAWRTLADGTQPLPTGASMTAAAWLAYGRYVLQHRETFAKCFRSSGINEHYGLGWWLEGTHDYASADINYASGSGGQGLYCIPELDVTAVHFGAGGSYKHDAMLRRLTGRHAQRVRG
jgi:CubicO group peptidase (beta-lactamase class C family)